MTFELKLPLLGFESATTMELEKVDEVFANLKSSDNSLSFTLINPYAIREYSFDIPISLQSLLGINEKSNLLIYNIMILQNPIEKSTVNFLAPIIFNTDNHTMAQVIIDNRGDFNLAEPISNFLKDD